MKEETKKLISERTKLAMQKPEVKEHVRLGHLNLSRSKETKIKTSNSMKKWHADNKDTDNYLQTCKKISVTNKIIFSQDKYREISRQTMMKLNNDPVFRQKAMFSIKNIEPNKQETKLQNVLDSLNLNSFKYVGNHSFWITYKGYNFNPDFVNNDNMQIIELFGCFWHYRYSKETLALDAIRLEAYKSRGYNVLIITDEELSNITLVKHKILEFVNNGKEILQENKIN